jgi:glycosyltransferase involved in cell wall biosynthesis
MTTPKVSVVMPVYNGERYIRAAIDSILAQSFKDFELVIINDGSSDGSAQVIESYSDSRIVYVCNTENTGLANVRNKGLNLVRGEYIAWLDCDDISLSRRLEKQVTLLDANPRIGLCGTWVRTIDGATEDVWKYPTDPEFLHARMLFDDPLATSSIMMRASCVREPELCFDLEHPPAEDYELWERISRGWEVTNIPEILTLYRLHAMQTSVVKSQKQKDSVWSIQNSLLSQLGIEATDDEMQLHLDIGAGWRFLPDMERVIASELWLLKIEKANQVRKIFPEDGLRRVLAERWAIAASAAVRNGLKVWAVYHRSDLSGWSDKKVWRLARLFLKCIYHGR